MPFPDEAILGINFFSALVNSFPITRGLRPLVMDGNELTCAEKKLIPRIASSGKDTFILVNDKIECSGICQNRWKVYA